MILSREQILGSKIETREVDAHEWGGPGDTVLVRALTQDEGNEWRRSMLRKVSTRDDRGKPSTEYVFDQLLAERSNVQMISIACINPDGIRLFTSENIEALSNISMAPIPRIIKVVMDISGLSQTAAEDAEKNFEPGPNESSSSD